MLVHLVLAKIQQPSLLERYGVDRFEDEIMCRETKDGGGIYEAMGYVGRKERPGFLSNPI
jgi:hypothetical protein